MHTPQPAVGGGGVSFGYSCLSVTHSLTDSCPLSCGYVWAAIDRVQPFAKVYTHFI